MNKNYSAIIILVLIMIVAVFVVHKSNSSKKNIPEQILIQNYKDATYLIEGRYITLTNGVSEIDSTSNSSTKIITRYFGNEVKHDLNDDGREDVAFILTQETGGTGVFFYVVAALNTPTGYIGSDAFLLGDRIAPQTTEINEQITSKGSNMQNVIVVNYAVQLPNEPFTTRPSVGKSVWLKLDETTMKFGEVTQNFEGESR